MFIKYSLCFLLLALQSCIFMDIFPVYYPVTQENNFRNNDSVWAGALTASFSYLFNDVAHRWTMLNYKKLEKIWIYYYAGEVRYQNPNDFFKYVGGPLADWAAADPDNFQHPCAARLSDALNRAGFKIPEIHGVTYLGGEGNYYFINAAKMSSFLNEQWGQYKCLPKGKAAYGVIFQTGFSGGVSGHLDVLIYKFAAGKRYNTKTYYWGIK